MKIIINNNLNSTRCQLEKNKEFKGPKEILRIIQNDTNKYSSFKRPSSLQSLLLILVFCFSIGLSACGNGTETCNPTTTGNSCATASPVTTDGDGTSSETQCTDDNDDGLDDTSGEECNTTDAAVSAIVNYVLKVGGMER